MDAKSLRCPNCGANLKFSDKKCKYCGSLVYVEHTSDLSNFSFSLLQKTIAFHKENIDEGVGGAENCFSLGLCYLELKQYGMASVFFDRAISFDLTNPFFFYYKAICLFCGKRPFRQSRQVVDEAEACLNTALLLNELPDFYYMWSVIRFDFFERKCFSVKPDFKELLEKSEGCENKDEIKKFLSFDFEKDFKYTEE